MIQELLRYLAAPAVVVAAVAWLMRTIVQESLRRESERLRSGLETASAVSLENLRHEAARQLESLRHEFDLKLEEHKVRFATLQARRVDLLVALYACLSEVATAANSADVSIKYLDATDWQEDVDKLQQACRAAQPAYHAALLYLPAALAERALKLISVPNEATYEFNGELLAGAKSLDAASEAFEKAFTINPLSELTAIGVEIRTLLGVEGQPLPSRGTASGAT